MKEGWNYKPIGEIADVTDFVANGSFATLRENVQYHDEPSYAVLVRVVDFSNDFDESKFVYVDKHAYDFLAKSSLQGGEIIMSNVGSLGKEFICPNLGMPMTLGPNAIVIRTKNNKFYYYCFFSEWFQELLKTISGRGMLAKFNKTQFKQLVVPVPPSDIQDKIVEELDQINALISIKEKQLKELEELEQTIFHEMFGDPIDNEKGWDVCSMPQICDIIDGDRSKNYPKQEDFSDEGYCLFLSAKNVTCEGFLFREKQFITKERDELLRKGKLALGDIILTTRGTIGNIALYDEKIPYYNMRINSGMVILRMNKDLINKSFFIHQFKMHLSHIKDKIASGTAQPQLPISSMNKIELILPYIKLQNLFSERIKATESLKYIVKRELENLQELLASRMQYWFD